MPGIEDFVIEAIVSDMQQPQVQAPAGSMNDASAAMPQAPWQQAPPPQMPQAPQMSPVAPSGMGGIRQDPSQYPMPQGPQNMGMGPSGRHQTLNPETNAPWGQYADQYEAERVASLQRRDASKLAIMSAIKGMDPQIQQVILQRLGIDPGKLQSELAQQQQLLQFKQQLEAPQNEIANTLKMMQMQQSGQQHAQSYGLQQQTANNTATRQDYVQKRGMAEFLGKLIEATPALKTTLGPALQQLLVELGINIGPPGSGAGGNMMGAPTPGPVPVSPTNRPNSAFGIQPPASYFGGGSAPAPIPTKRPDVKIWQEG